MGRTLVLNGSHEPLGVVPARRAVSLVLNQKVDVLEQNGHLYRSEKLEVHAPSVVRLKYFVHVPYRRLQTPSRRGVFLRDGGKCQYCGKPAENVDHVHPRSRGGKHSWDNVVAACRRCNGRKENKLPAEAGMKLRRQPKSPPAGFWLRLAIGNAEPEWLSYLPGNW